MTGQLGRREPLNYRHVDRYPLTAATTPTKPVPVTIGVDWHSSFDSPQRRADGRYWLPNVAKGDNLGAIRGGHCVCLRPDSMTDLAGWWDYYNQGAEGACFPAGTRVRLADGSHRNIEDIRTLDEVVTAEGRTGRVLQTMARMQTDGLVAVKLRGHHDVSMTPEHPVLTERGYVAALELRPGDRVAVTKYLPTPVSTVSLVALKRRRPLMRSVTFSDRWGGRTTVVQTAPPDELTLTPQLGRLVGLYLAEGHTDTRKVVWTFGKHETDTLAAETETLIRECLGAEPRRQIRPNKVVNIVLHGTEWSTVFASLMGTGSGAKHLGPLANGPRAFLQGVIEGWLAGDGHERRTQIQGVSVSPDLALDMHAIANGLGLRPTIRRCEPKASHGVKVRRPRWDVVIPTGDGQNVQPQDDAAVWRRVQSIELRDWTGFVFNLHVEGDESYTAEGLGVHNCVGFGSSRMMSLLNRARYDARWLYLEAQKVDYWPGENYSGTSVSAAMDILRTWGHKTKAWTAPRPAQGINANRWATSLDDIRACLQSPRHDQLEAVPLLNSWGRSYPHITWLPYSTLQELVVNRGGEAAVIVDR